MNDAEYIMHLRRLAEKVLEESCVDGRSHAEQCKDVDWLAKVVGSFLADEIQAERM